MKVGTKQSAWDGESFRLDYTISRIAHFMFDIKQAV